MLPELTQISTNNIGVQGLHKWLCEEAKTFNQQNTTQVPIPKLLGSHSDFAFAAIPPTETALSLKMTAEAKRLHTIEQRYRDLLLKACDIVSLANLPEQDRHLAMRPLELRRLYLPLRGWVEFNAGEEAKEDQWDEIENRRAISMGFRKDKHQAHNEKLRTAIGVRLAKTQRLVVLGDPGSGKTTLTRWIATAYLLRLKRDPNWDNLPDVKTLPDADLLPIIIRCRELDLNCLNGALDDFLSHTLRKAEMLPDEIMDLQKLLRNHLAAGTGLLMLDGIDEILDPTIRIRFCQQLETIRLAYPKASMIVTSRIVGYREMNYRLGHGFEHMTLADLAYEEKDDFVRRWCKLTETPENTSKATSELIHDVHSSDRIERMTGNPMLLTTMALVKRKVGRLPSRRAELYEEAIQVLLNWRSDVGRPLDSHEAIPQLEYIAYAMCEKSVQQLRRDEILTLIVQMRKDYSNIHQTRNHTPEEFLAQLEARTGLLVEAGRVRHLGTEELVYEFRHLTFQEYLAARALVNGRFPGRVIEQPLAEHIALLAGQTGQIAFTPDGAKELAVVENWREVLRLCGTICTYDDVDKLLNAILTPLPDEAKETARPRAILAGLCVADEPNASESMVQLILETFATHIGELDRNFEIRTGIHVTAIAIAETRWAGKLTECLIAEFLSQPVLQRDYVGDIAGIVIAKCAPTDYEALSAWWVIQTANINNPDQFLACHAALGIAALVTQGAETQLTEMLICKLLKQLNEKPPLAHAAAQALSALNDAEEGDQWKPTEKDLEKILGFIKTQTTDPEALRFLVDILQNEPDKRALEPLLTWLSYPSADLKGSILGALGKLRDERSVAPLIELFSASDHETQIGIIAALGEIRSKVAVDILIVQLQNNSDSIKTSALDALGTIGCDRATESIISLLNESNVDVRRAAIIALGQIGDARAVSPLVTQIVKTENLIANHAATALINIGNPVAAAPPINPINEDEVEICDHVFDALIAIDQARATEMLHELLSGSNQEMCELAIRQLAYLGDETNVAPLIESAKSGSAELHEEVIQALGKIGGEKAIDHLTIQLTNTNKEIHVAAAFALGRLGNDLAVEPLIELLNDSEVCHEAAFALSNFNSSRSIAVFNDLLKHTSPDMRKAAMRGLVWHFEENDQRLLSRDFDGVWPFIDPQKIIYENNIKIGARKLKLPQNEVRTRYEALAAQFGLKLSWVHGTN